jgi:Holliday junction resolvase RusA-like endonuclease
MNEEMEQLLRAAEMWRPRSRPLPLRKARKSHGWAANVACLPLPPGVNNLFPGRIHRHKSREYKVWLAEAALWWAASPLSKQAAWPLAKGTNVLWTLDAYFFMPTWVGDLDNKLKAPIDFLCAQSGLTDNRLTEIHAQRITGPERLRGMVLAIGLA